jgi:hypothetical protein
MPAQDMHPVLVRTAVPESCNAEAVSTFQALQGMLLPLLQHMA